MAKFRLKADLIPLFTERNVISPDTGKIKIRIPWKENRLSGEKCYEFEFLPTDVVEAANEFMASVLRGKRSPKLKVGGEWFLGDPEVPWFEELDAQATTTLSAEVHGVEVFTKKHRKLLAEYAVDKKISLPGVLDKNPTNQTLFELAVQHKQEKLSAR